MPTERFQFTGEGGHQLSAALELPDGEPAAFALFAHCFTCGKDTLAAKRISVALAAKGIAVLRFDFTGLGSSEGDFANSTFSSNVADPEPTPGAVLVHHERPVDSVCELAPA